MKRNNYEQYDKGQEISGVTFQQHQNQVIESLNSVMLSLGLDAAQMTVLWGLENSGVGTSYDIAAGAVFYNGEIFEVDAFAGTAGDIADVAFLRVLNVPVGDDIRFADGTISAVHIDHKYEIALGTPGAGEFALSTAPRLAAELNTLIGANTYTDQSIADLVDGETNLDTLAKIATAIEGLQVGGASWQTQGSTMDYANPIVNKVLAHNEVFHFHNADVPFGHLTVNPGRPRIVKLFCDFHYMKEGNDNDSYTIMLVYRQGSSGSWTDLRGKDLFGDGNIKHCSLRAHIELASSPTQDIQFGLKLIHDSGGLSGRISAENEIEFDTVY